MPDRRFAIVKQRPVYLDLPRIRLPLPGIVSILHRVSRRAAVPRRHPAAARGRRRRASPRPRRMRELKAAFAHPLAKLVLIGFVWAYLHHFCAGIRYLLLDLHQRHRPRARAPVERRRARRQPRADADRRGAAVVTRRAGGRRALRPHGLAGPAPHRRGHGGLHAARARHRAVERRHRLRAVEGAVRPRRLQARVVPVHGGAALPRVDRRARHPDGLHQAGRRAPRAARSSTVVAAGRATSAGRSRSSGAPRA